jgi:hypothetical protein
MFNNYFEDICAFTIGYRVNVQLANIYDLLNHREAVLLPIKEGEKAPDLNGWQKKTFADTQTERYQKDLLYAFHNTAIGVQLGNGVHAIDVDNDDLADQFLALNPTLTNTLRTRGSRGCQFWVKIDGECPEKVRPIKLADKTQVGEWRSKGGQSVIYGNHPSGNRYSVLTAKQPVTIKFADIRWPAGWVLPWDPTTKPKSKTQQKKEAAGDNLSRRIQKYIDAIPGAVSGDGGHNATYFVAWQLVHGFALSVEEALPFLQSFNGRCQPPWTEAELRHKLNQAATATDHKSSRGHLRGTNATGLPEVLLPGVGRNERSFAKDIAEALPDATLFLKNKSVVEIIEPQQAECDLGREDRSTRFSVMSPKRFTTWVEDHMTTGIMVSQGEDQP